MYELVSIHHDITLKITGRDEPNNGRTLHICELFINGENVTEKYFGKWNRLNEKIDNIQFDSPDKRFVFIPAESECFVIDTSTYKKITMPYKELSTIKFIGNKFDDGKLILYYSDEKAALTLKV